MNLDNQSQSMATVVETFLNEDTVDLIYDNDKLEQWNKLVNDLGLVGQTKIQVKEKSPIPFLPMNKVLQNVFSCLCPRKVAVKDYDVTPIPVEILDLIALSKREEYFDNIQIWYDDKNPDPACIGITHELIPVSTGFKWHYENPVKDADEAKTWLASQKLTPYDSNPVRSHNEKFYLIGKWGDVKHSLDELKEMAGKRFLAERRNEIKKHIKNYERELADLTTKAFDDYNFSSDNLDLPF